MAHVEFSAALRGKASVLYAEPDYLVHASGATNDPQFSLQWNLQNTGQNGGTSGADIHAAQAWGLTTGSPNTVVAVLDTGIDYTHQDLAANVWSAASGFSRFRPWRSQCGESSETSTPPSFSTPSEPWR